MWNVNWEGLIDCVLQWMQHSLLLVEDLVSADQLLDCLQLQAKFNRVDQLQVNMKAEYCREAYWESRRTSMIEPFCENS